MRYSLAICLLATAVPPAFSQTPAQFEVATVKPGDPADPQTMFYPDPNGARFRAKNASLKALIGYAWDKQPTQISGGPKWLDSDRFDIEAKPRSITAMPADWTSRQQWFRQLRAMLQSLLEDRFRVVVHYETRQEPVYELVLAKGGSRLKEPSTNEALPNLNVGRGQITANAMPLSRLTPVLSALVRRPVIDKTGLINRYDFILTFTPDVFQSGPPAPGAPPPVDTDTPSLFAALQEQLGLKLEPTKGPVEQLVVDRAEKPDAN